MDHRFYCDFYGEFHCSMELFPCVELDVNNFIMSPCPVWSMLIQMTYQPETDGWEIDIPLYSAFTIFLVPFARLLLAVDKNPFNWFTDQ